MAQPAAAPVAQPVEPATPAPAAPSAKPAKNWFENRYVRVGLAILGVLLVIVGVMRIANGLGGGGSVEGGPSGTGQTVDAAGFVGFWELYEGPSEGHYIALDLRSDGTGDIREDADVYNLTWKATSETEGTTAGGYVSQIMLRNEFLVLTSEDGAFIFSKPAGAGSGSGSASSSSASSTSSSSAPSSSSASSRSSSSSSARSSSSAGSSSARQANLQTIGSMMVGYVQVPTSWVDRTDEDVSQHDKDDYGMILVVNPDTEYVSPVQEHYAFAQAIQMTVRPTSYKEVADMILESYRSKPDVYGDADQTETTVGGRAAIFIATTVPDDNLQMGTFVIDRDGDGKVAVALTLNCGASDAQASEVLSYASTWHYE